MKPFGPIPAGFAADAKGGLLIGGVAAYEGKAPVQVMAMAANTKLVLPSKDILEETYQKMQPRPEAANRNGSLAWGALLRKLDRVDTSYRN